MTTTTSAYLQPILQAATLLGLKPYPAHIEHLGAVLDKLSPRGYPADVLPPVEALRILQAGLGGTVEELELLAKVWPSWSGDTRFRMTATTLTWEWSSKHSGRFARITVPFPTVLPMHVEVERLCDMDDLEQHSDECPQRLAEDDEEYSSECACESWVEQTVAATVTAWDAQVEQQLAGWLAQAVTTPVEPATFSGAEPAP